MSDGDHALSFVYLIGVLVLVVSALMVRRIPIGQGLKMFAGWVLIFLAAFVAFALKDDFLALGKRVLAESRGEGQIVAVGKALRIRKSMDGHFWVEWRDQRQDGAIPGRQRRHGDQHLDRHRALRPTS